MRNHQFVRKSIKLAGATIDICQIDSNNLFAQIESLNSAVVPFVTSVPIVEAARTYEFSPFGHAVREVRCKKTRVRFVALSV